MMLRVLLVLSALESSVSTADSAEQAYQAAFNAKMNKQLREQQVLLRDKLNEAREALKAAVAANSPDVKRAGTTSGCIPDTSTVLRNLTCQTAWFDQAVAQLPRARPVLHIQVGAGMGYGLANFLALWSDPSLTPQKWHKKLKQYGNRNTGRLVRQTLLVNLFR